MAVTRTAANRRANVGGMEVAVFVPGAFYQGVMPGGFGDPLTGYHIPGPRAVVEGTKRRVISFDDIPDPIQLPHAKIVIEVTDGGKVRKEVEVPFNENDAQPLHETFQNALSTGIIRIVPEDEVEAKYPRAWAKYDDHIVYLTEGVRQGKSALEMLKEAEIQGHFQKVADDLTEAEKARAEALNVPSPILQRKPPPPVPPKP